MYKLLEKLITLLISFIDGFERDDEKLIKTFELKGVKILTDTGYKDASHIHLTRRFSIYHIELENGYTLDCADKHILFDDNLNEVFAKDISVGCNIMTDVGPVKVTNVSYNSKEICMCDVTVDDDNHRYYSNHILSHNTTTSAIFMLHYILFNIDKNALVLGDKRKTAIEILDKLKKIYDELPFFLKPGIYKWNEGEIVLDNGCRCMAEATTTNSGISFTFHCVLADEFAKINKNIQETFYSHLFPTITAASARFMISSTVNGKDLFYRLYTAALMGENDYAPFTVTWDRVPEWDPIQEKWVKRDEEWHRKQIANYGSEEAFELQFGINFDTASNMLINRKYIQKCRAKSIKFVNKEIPGVSNSNNFYWHPDFDPHDLRKEFIIIPVDIAEGLGGDYTVAQICRMKFGESKTVLETIGFFRSNNTAREQCVMAIMELIMKYSSCNNCLLSIERNTYGELFVNDIKNYVENDPNMIYFDMSCIVKYYNDSMTKYTLGVKLTSNNKTPHCLLFQEDFERGLIVNDSDIFVFELENFCDDGTGHYKASFGHDDTVMAMVQLEFIKKTLQYKILLEEFEANYNIEDDKIYNAFDEQYNSELMYNMHQQPTNDYYGQLSAVRDFENADIMKLTQQNNIRRLNNIWQ